MDGRDTWAEADEQALRHNMQVQRDTVGPGVKINVCIKMNAYGFGADWVARIAAQEGIDGFAWCDADDAAQVRGAGVDLPVLLYPGTHGAGLQVLAQHGFINTAHDGLSLAACLGSARPFYLELDCGLGRLGFPAQDPEAILQAMGNNPAICQLVGAYAHFDDQLDRVAVDRQGCLFQRCVDVLQGRFDRPLERTVGASRVLVTDARWALKATNPSALRYGLHGALAGLTLHSVLVGVKGCVIAIRHIPRESMSGYPVKTWSSGRVVALVPAGYSDGLPRVQPQGPALRRGHQVPVDWPRHATPSTPCST